MNKGCQQMNSIHYFKAKSRLGMKYIPIHGTELNIGVEHGSEYILTDIGAESYEFPLPEIISDEKYYQELARYSSDFADIINNSLQYDEIQAVIGGDHSVSFASLLAIIRRKSGSSIGYIQIDSHLDINTHMSSPTKNFHGMFLRPFLGTLIYLVFLNLFHSVFQQ